MKKSTLLLAAVAAMALTFQAEAKSFSFGNHKFGDDKNDNERCVRDLIVKYHNDCDDEDKDKNTRPLICIDKDDMHHLKDLLPKDCDLSNWIKDWKDGNCGGGTPPPPTSVPDSGTTMGLMGMAMMALEGARRFIRK